MCTVSWIYQDDGYQLLCNRDERRTRAKALPPKILTQNGVRFIAPIDGDFGGTWIATNEFGVSICLLNGHPRESARPRLSRGMVVLKLIAAASVRRVQELLGSLDLSTFASFTLAALQTGQPATVVEWSGAELAARDPGVCLLTSSSYDWEAVQLARRLEFEGRVRSRNVRALSEFHESHAAEGGAYSVCMHRDDAETVSFSRVEVTRTETSFFYTPDAPCRRVPGERHSLAIAA